MRKTKGRVFESPGVGGSNVRGGGRLWGKTSLGEKIRNYEGLKKQHAGGRFWEEKKVQKKKKKKKSGVVL